jgi:type IV pilus assembly protein PilB
MKKSHRITRVVESILAGAMSLGASDVHIEPQDDYVTLRYRIDGMLVEFLKIDVETYKLTLSRIKLLSGLKLNITNTSQK